MKDKTVAILESRMRDHITSLVRNYGGAPFSAPALAEIPDVDPAPIDELIRDWNSAPPDIFIFQTGVGTRALFASTNSLGLTDVLLQLLDSAQVIVRGPKPATVLHSRKVRIDRAASNPFTTHEVLAEMHGTPLRGKRVATIRRMSLHSGPARRKIRWRSPTTIRLSRGQDAADVDRVQGERQRSSPTLRQLPWFFDPGAMNGSLLTRLLQYLRASTKLTSPYERYWTRHFVKTSTKSCPVYNEKLV